ncbi:MAG: restriction endonuclease subunit S [Candidatus Sedimenticola sp. (ex Thyasira tokunagai)]
MRTYEKYKPSKRQTVPLIPEHWDARKLKWVTHFAYGDSLPGDGRNDGDIPVFGSNGVVGHHDESVTNKPAIVVGRKGSYGKVNYSQTECFPIDTTYFIDDRSTKNDLRWLYYVLGTLGLDEYSQDSAVPGLSREYAYSRELPFVPNVEEQQTIARFLDHKTALIDQYIANKKKQIELLEKLRTAIISEAVTKGLNPDVEMKDSGLEWMPNVPKHWGIVRLGLVSQISNGCTPSKNRADYWQNGEVPWLSSGKVNDGIVKEANNWITKKALAECSLKLLPVNTVIVGMIGEGKTRGMSAQLNIEAAINQNLAAIFPGKNLESDFLVYVLKHAYEPLREEGRGGQQDALNCDLVAGFRIPFPPLDEQVALVSYLDKRTNKIDYSLQQLKEQIEKVEAYRTSLISEAVTGKIDVRGFKREPMEALTAKAG